MKPTDSLTTHGAVDPSQGAVPADVRPSDDEAFAAFFAATWPRAYRVAYGIAGDVGRAEDACQAAYARVYSSWRRIIRTDHPEAYVRRMVVNEVLTERRRAWWRHEQSRAEPEPVGRPEAHDRDGTGQRVTDRDSVWSAVLQLPPRQRAVIVLRYYEDLSEREIAAVLGCAAGTVKSQASLALTNLRRHAADTTTGDLR